MIRSSDTCAKFHTVFCNNEQLKRCVAVSVKTQKALVVADYPHSGKQIGQPFKGNGNFSGLWLVWITGEIKLEWSNPQFCISAFRDYVCETPYSKRPF